MSRTTSFALAVALVVAGALVAFGSFAAHVDYACTASGQPYEVVGASLRGNGIVDLIVSNNSQATISVLLGNGDGTFAAKTDYTTLAGPQGLAIADFNGDGKLDVAVISNTGSVGNSIQVFKGVGDGTLNSTAIVTNPGIAAQSCVAAADVNADGKVDLIVGNATATGAFVVLIGSGDGSFSVSSTVTAGNNIQGLCFGNFGGGHGVTDLAVVSLGDNKVRVYWNNGSGSYTLKSTLTTSASPFRLAAGSLRNNGADDLVVATFGVNTADVFLGNGDGTFAAHVTYSTLSSGNGAACGFVALADTLGSGNLDAIFQSSSDAHVSLLLGNGDGTFGAATTFVTLGTNGGVFLGDFNGDRKLDIAACANSSSKISVLLQTTAGSRATTPGGLVPVYPGNTGSPRALKR